MNVATLYFAVWLIADMGASNTVYAVGNGVASLLVVLSVPLLGAISDGTRRRKPWVVGFTLVSCAACAAIGVLGQTTLPVRGDEVRAPDLVAPWHPTFSSFGWVLVAFVMANYAYQAAQPFYNAMMSELVPPEERGRLSGIGTAVGDVGTRDGLHHFIHGAVRSQSDGFRKGCRDDVVSRAHGAGNSRKLCRGPRGGPNRCQAYARRHHRVLDRVARCHDRRTEPGCILDRRWVRRSHLRRNLDSGAAVASIVGSRERGGPILQSHAAVGSRSRRCGTAHLGNYRGLAGARTRNGTRISRRGCNSGGHVCRLVLPHPTCS